MAETKEFNPITAKELTASIKFGMNLGNTFDATGSSGLDTETSWGNPKITPELLAALKAGGLDVIRLSTSWEPHLDAEYNIDPAWMDRVQSVVDSAIDAGLYVILNTHHEDKRLLPMIAAADFDGAHKELSRVWAQIAQRFGGYDEHLIFNIFNEPRQVGSPLEWQGGTAEVRETINKLNVELLKQIRTSGGNNAKRIVMVTPVQASIWYAAHLDLPWNDPYMLVSIHAYEPYDFALNRAGTDKFPANSNIKDVFGRIDQLFVSKGAAVIMDETGAMNKNGNLKERVAWAKEFSSYARSLNVPVVLWDNGVTDVAKGESFGLIDRATCEWIYPEIVEEFVK
ncbi:MAG: glycoside hydrolase family 5 protein [Oscillospiraceae bacterium]|jgi:endoglucanase|nr:glycoside hydrolase family 5 protein [Oscillospiraceae bacterium]